MHSGDEFSISFKVNYISEDHLPVMVTSRFSGDGTCCIVITEQGLLFQLKVSQRVTTSVFCFLFGQTEAFS